MKIRYNRANLYKCGDLVLVPGLNEISDKIWNKVAENKGVISRMEMGAIVVSESVEAPKRGRKPKDEPAEPIFDADGATE